MTERYYMENNVGFFIKKHRLEQNLSQESLCNGICVVSYLSKIENNLVNAHHEIIEKLFSTLGIPYLSSENSSEERQLFHDYFEAHNFGADTQVLACEILKKGNTFLYSHLWGWYQLFLAYEKICDIHKNKTPYPEELTMLERHKSQLSTSQRYALYLAKGHFTMDNVQKIIILKQTELYASCGENSVTIAKAYLDNGNYQESLSYCTKSYYYGCEEGNLHVMYHSSLIQGSCYAQLYKVDLMKKYYQRALNLCRNHPKESNWVIYYNMGATLLQMKEYHESKTYLHLAQTYGENVRDPFNHFLLHHKLSILYYSIQDKENGRLYANKAKDDIDRISCENLIRICTHMVDMISYWEHDDYQKNDCYMTLVEELYDEIKENLFHGLARFHKEFYIDALTYRRRYKEALMLSQEQ